MNQELSRRLRGLDTLRALAIVAVMFFHLGGYMPPSWYPATRYGWIGVDLFFVLSGYLIGVQLCRKVRDGNGLSPLWQFLTFTVNLLINYPAKNSFSHVWSLCVEEYFYLMMPLMVLLLSRKPSLKKTIAAMIAVLCGGIAIRAWAVLHVLQPLAPHHGERSLPFIVSYMKYIYYPTWSRLDGLLAGVVVALLELFCSKAWIILNRYRNPLFFVGSGITAFALYIFQDRFTSNAGVTAFSSVFGFSFLSLGLGMLVMSAAMEDSWLARTNIPGTRPIAIMAYSLYLSHKSVANVVYSYYPHFMDAHPGWATVIVLPAAFASASLLYFGVERPFLLLRDRRKQPAKAEAEALLNPGV